MCKATIRVSHALLLSSSAAVSSGAGTDDTTIEDTTGVCCEDGLGCVGQWGLVGVLVGSLD